MFIRGVDQCVSSGIISLRIHGVSARVFVGDEGLFRELSIELLHFIVNPPDDDRPEITVHFQEYCSVAFSKAEIKRIRSLKKIRLTAEIENYSDVAQLTTYLFARKGWNPDEAVILVLSQLAYLLRLTLSQKYDVAVFHGASLSYGGQGILFVGQSGAGKTSLSYLCARQGFQYLSDEDSFVLFDTARRVCTLLGFQRRLRLHSLMPYRAGSGHSSRGQFSGFGEQGMVYDPRQDCANAYCLRAPLKKIIILNNHRQNARLTFQKIPAEQRFFQLLKYFESATVEYSNGRDLITRYNRRGFDLVSLIARSYDIYFLNYDFRKHSFELPFKVKAALSSSEIGEENNYVQAIPRFVDTGILV
ncbi:MAG: hypothetical protein ACOY90_10435 [Candidatus Zhuqueibacterota bacterium]